MGKLPNSFKSRNRTSRNFRDQYAALPEEIQRAIREACKPLLGMFVGVFWIAITGPPIN